ncbi:MAG TPA: DUF177 domain-containing protein [Terriglobia bacterium]|nr:DUF177 domain-containing protein [Terriglobia bacterium]
MLITREELALRKITVDHTYPAGEFDDRGHEYRQSAPLRIQAVAELLSSDIRIRGRIGTRLEMECDRCIAQMALVVEQDFDVFYRPVVEIAREGETEVPNDELEVGFYSGEGVELADLVKEQVILSLPMKRVCRPDCRGLCPVCGSNLNLKTCECQQAATESPFAALLRRS